MIRIILNLITPIKPLLRWVRYRIYVLNYGLNYEDLNMILKIKNRTCLIMPLR